MAAPKKYIIYLVIIRHYIIFVHYCYLLESEMKFKGMIATDMSGSMDGVTASSNTHGSYFKKRSRPSQPNSAAQLRAKSAFARAASIFRTLTGAAIAGWNNFAKTIFSAKTATNTGEF